MSTQRSNWRGQRKDEDGKWLCRNCHGPLPKRRSSYCSDACFEAFYIANSSSYAKRKVFRRDRGVCALCGVDTVRQREHYGTLRAPGRWTETDAAREYRTSLGVPLSRRAADSWWDADHIVPVVEGGGQCSLDNLRTLCIRCHHQVTKELRKRLSEKRSKEPRLID